MGFCLKLLVAIWVRLLGPNQYCSCSCSLYCCRRSACLDFQLLNAFQSTLSPTHIKQQFLLYYCFGVHVTLQRHCLTLFYIVHFSALHL
ncbi:hypothetical protein BS78_K105300 [Paspalum vaginatum]|uniref:Secreted protein n=1 Tax=Paspalum vaginatum TaxID=158149 RepID=A0A9W7X8U3_9POAL|nr:hypothetical protein BS78_K105300 [Paspalum vaginatum]